MSTEQVSVTLTVSESLIRDSLEEGREHLQGLLGAQALESLQKAVADKDGGER